MIPNMLKHRILTNIYFLDKVLHDFVFMILEVTGNFVIINENLLLYLQKKWLFLKMFL